MDIVHNESVDHSAFAPLRRYMPMRVRWTFWDLLLVALITLVLSGLSIALIRVLLPTTSVDVKSPAVNLGAGGVIYLITLLAVLGGIVLRKRGTWREIGFRRTSPWWILLVFGIFVLQYVVLIVVSQVIQALTGGFQNPQITALIGEGGFSWLNFVVAFGVGAIIAPIVEEMAFRGLLYQWLRSRVGMLIAVLVSSAVFAAVHFILPLFPALFIVGLLLTLAFEWSQSLWVSIALHMMLNGFQIILLYAALAAGIQLSR